ncbi:hypothetical protein IL306_013094 [Fusarium sp. DS 682]|nr:hypothetical protein IL306_013094 [Fusarium sp. DS 682]
MDIGGVISLFGLESTTGRKIEKLKQATSKVLAAFELVQDGESHININDERLKHLFARAIELCQSLGREDKARELVAYGKEVHGDKFDDFMARGAI